MSIAAEATYHWKKYACRLPIAFVSHYSLVVLSKIQCGHCQEMAPAWERLAKEWEGHEQGLIAEADCTKDATSEKWCQKEMGVSGFPTLLYGDPSYGGIFLEQYTEGRTYEDLSTFARETVAKPFCTPGNLDACDKDTRKQIETYSKMSVRNLDKAIEEKEKLIEAARKAFEKEFDRMQAIYDEKAQDFELTSARIKYDLKMLQSLKETKE